MFCRACHDKAMGRSPSTRMADLQPGSRLPSPERHCERSEAIHLTAREVTMDCFAALAMTWIQFRSLAALIARGLHLRCPPELRGRREDRVLAAPAVSR